MRVIPIATGQMTNDVMRFTNLTSFGFFLQFIRLFYGGIALMAAYNFFGVSRTMRARARQYGELDFKLCGDASMYRQTTLVVDFNDNSKLLENEVPVYIAKDN